MSEPWFRFFPSDWLGGVAGLSAAERGVYITLLAVMYDHGGALPRDDARLARQCGLPKAGFARALAALISTGKILVDEDGRLFNSRAKSELTERAFRISSASAGARSRWKNNKKNQGEEDAEAYATAMRPQCDRNATRARSTTTIDTTSVVSEKRAQERAAFARFWDAWPNKVGRPAAERAFAKAAAEVDAILGGVAAYVRDKPADRPWLNPATFLNQRRWEDAPAPVSATPARGPPSNGREPGKSYFQGLMDAAESMSHERDNETPILDLDAAS